MADRIIYIDGEYLNENDAKISVFDHGVLYGDGIFEGIRAYNGRIFKGKEHIDRLFSAAKAIMLEIPLTKEEVAQMLVETCKRNNLTDGYIRLVVTRGKGDLGLSPTKCTVATVFCIAANITLYPEEMYEKGMPIITASQRRNKATIIDPQIKSLNYLNNILAKIQANQAGVPEALMLTHDGIVAECTGDNIFIIKEGIIFTPPIHVGILDGITRNTVIKLARDLGYDVQEKEFTQYNLYNADECFLTGTAAEVIAVTSVDERIIGAGICGPITKKLLAAFQAHTKIDGIEIK
ncbi:branched-chain-amino-acid transaminase [Candidatus Epulonipiscium viviparus]|nr:branched-chain-amino-acid transaminase [Candidatus Epulopiscium viviparus]